MNKCVNVVLVAALGFIGLCGYWLLNPHRSPRILRDNIPGLELPTPASPVSNFRAPQFGN